MNIKSFNAFVLASLVFLTTTTSRAQSAYSNAIVSLNPVGYWPMHEVEAAAPGDIETNYGTLGLLGTGYYPDWATTANGFGIKRGIAGAIVGDSSDTAVNFTCGASPAAATYTNNLYVPHTSPLSTLNPPFSVECWFYPTNTTSEDIWAQCGDEGLNQGGNSGGNAGFLAGVRLVWENGTNTGFQIFNLNGSQNTAGFVGNFNVSPQAYPTNNWYHLVLICDANTNFSLAVNGSTVSFNPTYTGATSNGVGSYTPDYWTPITIGGGRGGTRACAGYIDEFAVYTNVIGDIGTHYSDGTGGGAGAYFHDVTNDNPVIYLRMDAPAAYTAPDVSTWPALINYGMTNGVAVGNGVYTPGTMPGIVTSPVVNPNGVPFGGVSSNLVALSGVSSFADAGYAPAYNPTGAVPFSVTALFRGNPCDQRNQTIVGHTTSSYRLWMSNAGKLQWQIGGVTLASTGVYNDGNWHQVVAIYTPASDPAVKGTNALFVDGVLDNGVATVSTNGITPGSPLDVMIGGDPQYTNSPVGAGQQFAGQVCEVALFSYALTPSQIQTLYSNCEVAPYITGQPVTGRVVNGGPGTYIYFGVDASGSSTLAYQWYFNTSSNYSGATKLVDGAKYTDSTNLQVTVTNLAKADNGYYYVVVTNNYGSVTSILASLTVYSSPSVDSQLPVPYTNLFTLYAGASPTFSISAEGAQPISYFWYTNGVLDAAATDSSMLWTNVQMGSISNYCILTNVAGSETSLVWTATVIAAPNAPYPTNVLADNPIGYWRLNEGPDDNNGNDGVISVDYAGGNNGIYTNVYIDNSGYSFSTDPSDTSTIFGEYGSLPAINEYAGQIQGIDFAATNGANGEFTVEAWADGHINSGVSFEQVAGGALATKGLYGVDDQFNLGIDSTRTHYRFYVRSANGTVYTAGSGSSPALDGNWHHIVGVCDEANGQLLLYVDGVLANTAVIPTNSGVYEAPEPMIIGAGTADGVNYTNQFIGVINDVAVYNHALSVGRIQAQYSSVVPGGISPYFIQTPPASVTVNVGTNLNLPAAVAGTTPMGYYWTDVKGGTNVAASVTNGIPLNATLTVSNVPVAWNNDQLKLTVTNAYGTNSLTVSLSVLGPPVIINDLPLQITLPSGSYTYSIGISGISPFSYQWYNAGAPMDNQTNATYTAMTGSPGSSTTYYVVVTNVYGAVTSSVSTFTTFEKGQLTNAYAAGILQFRPVGYWPMHEVEPPAPGDIETNYGTLGLLGTGYYPDWASGTAERIGRRYTPGPLTNDPDPCVNFLHSITGGSGFAAANYIDYLFVPHTSPWSSLIPPFSVECWVDITNATKAGNIIWGQFGYDFLNGPGTASGTASGAGPAGVTLNWNGTWFASYQATAAADNVNNTGQEPSNQWYYAVLTCDASSNSTLYLNGTPTTAPASVVGRYLPDYWTPLTIGGGRGGTRAIAGYVADFAIYTNALSADDISQKYNIATNANSVAGQYFDAVTNDNPVIYYRMDAPTYVAPSVSTWPVLLNYGSAAPNGVYSPGTMPGIVPGPATIGGIPYSGLSSGPTVGQLSGVSSFADAGYDPAYNPTGSNANFSVTALFRGNPCDGRFVSIVGHGTNSWQLGMSTNGCLVFNAGNGNGAGGGTGNAAGDITSVGVYNDGNWHQVVAVSQANEISIYVDGILDTNGTPTGITPTSVIPGNTDDVMIGSDPSYTNSPAGVGRSFAGQVCDVALLTNALNAGEVSALYAAAVNPNQIPAYVAPEPPLSTTVASGGTLSLTAGAAGASQVGYQWQFTTNGGDTDVLQTGAGNSPLNANLTVPNIPLTWNGGQLELTVTNAYGTNSAFIALSVVIPVNPNPTNIVATVTNNVLYLTWPSDHIGWRLQAQTNSLSVGISTNWVDVANANSTNQVIIPINLTNGSVFYRLVYP